MQHPAIEIKNVSKVYNADSDRPVKALREVTLAINDNEFFTLLGPSGCGKTTLLRNIAGFDYPSSGEILLFGESIRGLPPQKRPVNTVFQNYALFPHMTVADNVRFPMKMLRRSRRETEDAVVKMLALVKMSEFAERMPDQLSGGQQQRVALARALAPHPKVLLLDEPLSALDLKLRQEMRVELKNLQRQTGITFVFVTHDQVEALTMSDRIAVMSMGRLQQQGPPIEIYERPVNRFVADFIGETNFIECTIATIADSMAQCVIGPEQVLLAHALPETKPGETATLALRPEKISLTTRGDANKGIPGHIQECIYIGTDTNYRVKLKGSGIEIMVRGQNAISGETRFRTGDPVLVHTPDGAAKILTD